VNNPKTRTIEPEPTKSRVIKKAFEEYAQGRHTLLSLGERLSFWGVVSGTGKPICKATLQRMLTNKVYLGIIVHNGETYEDGFPAIVSRATFEAVQKILKQRARPRKSKKRHNFPFVGLLTCGESADPLPRNLPTDTAEPIAIIVARKNSADAVSDICARTYSPNN